MTRTHPGPAIPAGPGWVKAPGLPRNLPNNPDVDGIKPHYNHAMTNSDAVQATLDEAQSLIGSGRQIAAIKLVRERFGVGLKQAKDLVDGLAAGRRAEIQMAFQVTGFRPHEPRELPESSEDEVRQLLAQGKKIEAIKHVRQQLDLSLKEAKDLVEAFEAGRGTALGRADSTPEPEPRSEAAHWAEIDRLARAGRKIEAIKHHREVFGTSLADSKAAVESRTEGRFPRTPSPTSPVEEPQTLAQRLGVLGWLIVFGLALLFMIGCAAVVGFALSQA